MPTLALLATCPYGALTLAIGQCRWIDVPADGLVVALGEPCNESVSRPMFGPTHPLVQLCGDAVQPVERETLDAGWPFSRDRYEPRGALAAFLDRPGVSARLVTDLPGAEVRALAVLPYAGLADWASASWRARPDRPRTEVLDWLAPAYPHGLDRPDPVAVAVADALHQLAVGAGCRRVAMEGAGRSLAATQSSVRGVRLFADAHPDVPLEIVLHRSNPGEARSALRAIPALYMSGLAYRTTHLR